MSWRELLGENIEELESRGNEPGFSEALALALFVGEIESGGVYQYLESPAADSFYNVRAFAEKAGLPWFIGILESIESVYSGGAVPAEMSARRDVVRELEDENGEIGIFEELQEVFEDKQEELDVIMDAIFESLFSS